MFSVFSYYSKRVLVKGFVFHYLINTKKSLKIPIPGKINFFSTISLTTVSPESLNKKTNSIKSPNGSSLTVWYLINSCGLSPEIAKSVSEKVHIETTEIPDLVLKLLKNHGFKKTHISRLIQKQPNLLLSDPEKSLLPKIEFFRFIGLSKSDTGRVLSANRALWSISLENQLIPSYKFLKGVFHSDITMITLLKRKPWIFYAKKDSFANITYLSQLTVPGTSIELLLMHHPTVISVKHKKFREAVDKAKEMGFDPSKSTFVLAVRVFTWKSNNLIWDRCFEAYKKWGLSEHDILLAFQKHPHCMCLSEKNIETKMDYFVNKMGYDPKVIVDVPTILFYDLEKRIIPRCSVIHVLTSEGLLKKRVSLSTVLVSVENIFLERYVTRYEDELPQLMSVYLRQVSSLSY